MGNPGTIPELITLPFCTLSTWTTLGETFLTTGEKLAEIWPSRATGVSSTLSFTSGAFRVFSDLPLAITAVVAPSRPPSRIRGMYLRSDFGELFIGSVMSFIRE